MKVLEYYPERQRVESSPGLWLAVVAPALVLLVAGAIWGAEWGLGGAAVVAIYFLREHRRLKRRAHAILCVDGGRLKVTNAGGRVIFDVGLDELREVTLETKTVQTFLEDTSGGFPDIRPLHTRMDAPIDNARIELVATSGSLTLTDHYTSSIDASDWRTKIRRFLRENAWLPFDERAND